jgi:hypothetical protein
MPALPPLFTLTGPLPRVVELRCLRQKRHRVVGPCPGTVPRTPVHAGWTRRCPSQPGPLHVGAGQAGSEPVVPRV